ncbi:hypothetical protein [Acinetobacter sp. ASP199]|uniref:hypothetical protein n=1 Tax=unclassified Acinetobacter TaxID=196816 RepID=UPI001F607A6F|nr:hypothetical protein [Acinetobacter sp. ASP199]UNT59835.1 hypothetical protein IHE35_03100 [Acinetobacter sp. ASP199]
MPIIVIFVAVISLGIFWAYPKYEMMQLEDQARQQLQSGRFAELEAQYKPLLQREKVDFSVLDQYPNIRFYTRRLEDENKKLSVKSEQNVKNIACDSVEAFQNFDQKSRTAVLNVIEKDQIVFHMNVKNKFGIDMMQHQQKLSDCPNFVRLRALKVGEEYVPPPKENQQVDMVAPAVSTSVAEEAAQPLS